MSNKIAITSAYIEELTVLIQNKNSSKLVQIITELHIADIAEIIENLSDEHAKYFYNLIANEEESVDTTIEEADHEHTVVIEENDEQENIEIVNCNDSYEM